MTINAFKKKTVFQIAKATFSIAQIHILIDNVIFAIKKAVLAIGKAVLIESSVATVTAYPVWLRTKSNPTDMLSKCVANFLSDMTAIEF